MNQMHQQQQQHMMQQGGMVPMDGGMPQQQYGNVPQQQGNISYGGQPAPEHQQIQRLIQQRPMGQQMHSQNMSGVPQQQMHGGMMPNNMQMRTAPQQGGQQPMGTGQMMAPGGRMMIRSQQGAMTRAAGPQFLPQDMQIFYQQLQPTQQQQLQQLQNEDPQKMMGMLRQMMSQTLANRKAPRPQQPWNGGEPTTVQQNPNATIQTYAGVTNYANTMPQTPTGQAQLRFPPGYQQQRGQIMPNQVQQPQHHAMQPQQANMSGMAQPMPTMYRDNLVPPGSMQATNASGLQQYIPRPNQPGVPQNVQIINMQPSHPQQQPGGVPYNHPASGPSPGSYQGMGVGGAYPSPSPAPALSSGTSPGYVQDASPGFVNLPGNAAAKVPSTEPSPLPPSSTEGASNMSAEGEAYKEKIRDLQVYLDYLKRNMEQQQREGNVSNSASAKCAGLIAILEGRTKVTYDVLLKCEENLKKMCPTTRRQPEADSKTTMFQPLLDAVVAVVANNKSTANAVLKRSFDFPWASLPAGKRICPPRPREDPKEPQPETDDDSVVPLMIQREVASLEPKFRITLDKSNSSTTASNEKTVNVCCQMEDKTLPLVPLLKIRIPVDYPTSNPKYILDFDDYVGTSLFDSIQKNLTRRFSKLNGNYSITTILNHWEVCVRQACLV